MSVQNKDSFENKIREKVGDHEFSYNEDAWKNMQQMLSKDKNAFNFKIFKKTGLLVFSALLICSVVFYAGYLFRQYTFKKSTDNITDYHSEIKSNQPSVSFSIPKQKETNTTTSLDNKLSAASLSSPISSSPPTRSAFSNGSFADHGFSNEKHYTGSAYKLNNDQNRGMNKEKRSSIAIYLKEKSAEPDKAENTAPKSLSLVQNNIGQINSSINLSGKNDQTQKDSMQNNGAGFSKLDSTKSGTAINSTAFNQPIHSEIKTRTKTRKKKDDEMKNISFGPLVGINFLDHLGPNSNQFGLGFSTIGAFINFPVTNKFTIQSGISSSGLEGNTYTKTTITRGDAVKNGFICNSTTINIYNQGLYEQLPAILKYKILPHFWLMAGLQLSYSKNMSGTKVHEDYIIDGAGNMQRPMLDSGQTSINLKDYPEANILTLQMPLGIQWTISNSFNLTGLYYMGITDNINHAYHYTAVQGNTLNSFQLRLGYKMFHKRFNAD